MTATAPNIEGKNLFQRLVMVKQAIGHVGKTAKAPPEMGGFMFTPWEAVGDRLGDILAEHGIVLLPCMPKSEQREVGQTKSGKTIYRTFAHLTLTFVNADDPKDRETIKWDGEGDDMADKGTQKAGTSAEKYALMKLFLLGSMGEQTDTDRGAPEAASRNTAAARAAANGGAPTPRLTTVSAEPIGAACPECGDGDLQLKTLSDGRRFIGCSHYPQCKYVRQPEPVTA